MPPEHSPRGGRLLVGLMSGTSLDGIDAALVHIAGPATRPRVRLVAFETLSYPRAVRQTILRVATGESATAGEISQLNFLLGELFAEAALRVCRKGHVPLKRLAAIGSHGQTIFHQGSPTRVAGRRVSSTLQIAEPAIIAERTGITVVADFRPAEIAAGGQGAPLVAIVDYLLLREAEHGTVALNIGGIANFTVIPAGAGPNEVFGFDTGPGNMLIDGLVRHFTNDKKTYDAGGRWAAKGQVIEPLLDKLLRLPFFAKQPPKTAGREQFGRNFLKEFFLRGEFPIDDRGLRIGPIKDRPSTADDNHYGARPEDLLRTATELTARSIASALDRFVLKRISIHRLIISGGGAHNRLLVERLAELLPTLRIHGSGEVGIAVDAKEAIAFAILADRTLHGLPGNLPSVTGARRSLILGKISRP